MTLTWLVLDRAHRFLDPLADEVEERRDLAGKV
jgi:hypothetical protein